MTAAFARPALICNTDSGSHDKAVAEQIASLCQDAGAPIIRTYALPGDDIPDAAALAALRIDLLLVWTGDGTLGAAASVAAGWDGAILPLPGGTLNLLSKALNGDRPATGILADALAGTAQRRRIPTIRCDAGTALITIVAGPATRWAEVRETMRSDGLIEATRSAPDAMAEMQGAPGVRVGGGKDYQAIILTPVDSAIRADGILTGGAADLLRHGLAWLGGDFRDGPSEAIAATATVEMASDAAIGLELDGELAELPSPARFVAATSVVDFIATAPRKGAPSAR